MSPWPLLIIRRLKSTKKTTLMLRCRDSEACHLSVVCHLTYMWVIYKHTRTGGPKCEMLRLCDAGMLRCRQLSIIHPVQALSRNSRVLSGICMPGFWGQLSVLLCSAPFTRWSWCFACFLSAKFIASFVSHHYPYGGWRGRGRGVEGPSQYIALTLWFSYFSHCQWYIIGQMVATSASAAGSSKQIPWKQNDIE